MKLHDKTVIKRAKPEFNPNAGTLLLTYEKKSPTTIRAHSIFVFCWHQGHQQLYIRSDSQGCTYAYTNYSVAHHFYLRALHTGESFDLRPICYLPKKDELYKDYKSLDASEEVKKELAARVKLIPPGSFI